MFNKETLKEISFAKTLGLAWVLFTTLFFLFSVLFPVIESGKVNSAMQLGYNNGAKDALAQATASFSGNVLQNGYNNGYGTAIMQLGKALQDQYVQGCKEPVPVTIGTGSVNIVSVDCFQKIAENAASGKTAPTQQSPETQPKR